MCILSFYPTKEKIDFSLFCNWFTPVRMPKMDMIFCVKVAYLSESLITSSRASEEEKHGSDRGNL